MKAIIGGKIILKDRILEGSALLYSDVIEGIVPLSSVPEDAEIIDAKGGYVAPGLIDMHIHGYLGKDVCDGEEESIRTISKGLLANGVTGYLPTTMTVDMKVIRKALEVCRNLKEESKDWDGSVILGCHAEGPFISESCEGKTETMYGGRLAECLAHNKLNKCQLHLVRGSWPWRHYLLLLLILELYTHCLWDCRV